MNSKILLSLATLATMSAGLGYGTYAFFSDTETSTGNLFTAGDLDLTLNGLNGITASIGSTSFAPGDSTTGAIVLRNEGTIFTGNAQNHSVDLDFKALTTVTDDSGNANDADDGGVSATPMDRYLVLTTLDYDGTSLIGLVGDVDEDGVANTLADLAAKGVFSDLSDPGASGKTLTVAVQFLSSAPNHLKRDRVDVDFTFFLAQAGEVDLS